MPISAAPLNGAGLGEAFRHSAAGTSSPFALAAAPTNGNTLLLVAANGIGGPPGNTQKITSIVQAGVTWTEVAESNDGVGICQVWVGTVGAGANLNFTMNSLLAGATANIRCNVSEWSGVPELLDNWLDSSSSSATTAIASASITPTNAVECVLLAAVRSQLGALSAPTGGFTALTSGSTGYGFAFQKVAAASGSYSTTWTQTSGTYETLLVAIRQGSAPPPSGEERRRRRLSCDIGL